MQRKKPECGEIGDFLLTRGVAHRTLVHYRHKSRYTYCSNFCICIVYFLNGIAYLCHMEGHSFSMIRETRSVRRGWSPSESVSASERILSFFHITHFHQGLIPNVVVEWLTFLIRIREVPVQSRSADRLHRLWFLVAFLRSLQEKSG
jgi:hypothetical protein